MKQIKKQNIIIFIFILTAVLLLFGSCRSRIIKSDEKLNSTADKDLLESMMRQESQPPNTIPPYVVAEENASVPDEMPSRDSLEDTPYDAGDNIALLNTEQDEGLTAPSDGKGIIGIIEGEYNELLEEGLGSLYECQLGYVYFEFSEDYRTADSTTEIHSLIIAAGGYNVAEKKRDMVTDDGWILRKNPTLIVKCVPQKTLGAGVMDTGAAEDAYSALILRTDWNKISAVINNSVLLVSSEMTESAGGRLILKLYIAKALYPELFGSFDVDGLAQTLLGEGIYAY